MFLCLAIPIEMAKQNMIKIPSENHVYSIKSCIILTMQFILNQFDDFSRQNYPTHAVTAQGHGCLSH